jgi:hypothetical protein
MWKKQIQPGEKVPLKLTATERKLVLEDLMCLDQDYEQIIRSTPSGKPVMLTLDELEDFGGFIAAEANHCDDKKKQKKLDAIFEKLQGVQDKYTDAEPTKTPKPQDAKTAQLIADQAVQVAGWTAQALVAAEQLRIKTKPVGRFPLKKDERAVLSLLPIRPLLKSKLLEGEKNFTVAEVGGMTLAVAEHLPEAEPMQQIALLIVVESLMDCLEERITQAATQQAAKGRMKTELTVGMLFQFKITLLDIKPPIWRRIQVQDCTLDKLHEHIQTAMGWTNSHLHQFEIKGQRYGDPELLDEGFDDFGCEDSTTTMVSEVLPKTGKRFAFKYEYDFGDSWEHEVLFEGRPTADPKAKYPLCVEGERACPPEDVGGTWGYETFLAAKDDPDHEEHEMYSEWCPDFDPEAFDAKKATKEMKNGLPDWRQFQ